MAKSQILARLFKENPLTPYKLVLPPGTEPLSEHRVLLEIALKNYRDFELTQISLDSLPPQHNQQNIEQHFLLQNQYVLMFKELKPPYQITLPNFIKEHTNS